MHFLSPVQALHYSCLKEQELFCQYDFKILKFGCPGDLLTLLNVVSDDKILPTTYGELRPPLGKHRLKVG